MKSRFLQVDLAAWLAFVATFCSPAASGANTVPPYVSKLEPLLREAMRAERIPGALVFIDDPRRGQWAAALGSADLKGTPMPLDGYVRVGSISKTFTAASVLRLVDRNVIALDTPIEHYLPNVVPNGANISIRQLLNMTAGLFNNTEDCRFNQGLDRNPYLVFTPQQSLAIAFNHAPYFAPGTSYHYSNTNYLVLGLLLEKVTGMPLAKVYRELIFRPLGMRHTSLPALADASIPLPHPTGYLYGTNVQSLNVLLAALRFDFLDSAVLVSNGTGPVDATNWNPSPYWSAGSVISTLHDLTIWAKAYGSGALLKPATFQQQTELLPSYTYGLGIAESPRGFLGHDGAVPGYSSITAYSPQLATSIVLLLNTEITPNTLLVGALPVTNLATIIQQALYPQIESLPATGPALKPTPSKQPLCPEAAG